MPFACLHCSCPYSISRTSIVLQTKSLGSPKNPSTQIQSNHCHEAQSFTLSEREMARGLPAHGQFQRSENHHTRIEHWYWLPRCLNLRRTRRRSYHSGSSRPGQREAAIQRIRACYISSRLEAGELNMTSYQSITDFAALVKQLPRVNAVILSAGILSKE